MLTLADLTQALPGHLKTLATQDMVDRMNGTLPGFPFQKQERLFRTNRHMQLFWIMVPILGMSFPVDRNHGAGKTKPDRNGAAGPMSIKP